MVLTDVVMPGMNGRELAEALMLRKPGLAVVYMSGYTDDIIGHHGILPDEMFFIQKPFQKEEILAKVQEALAAS